MLRYAQVTARELWAFRARPVRITLNGTSTRVVPLMVAFANGSQYGNGAFIAPGAVLDDGLLNVVAVGDRSLLAAVRQIPALFSGRVASVAGVSTQRTTRVVVEDTEPIRYHVDGEPCTGGTRLEVMILAGALRVISPQPGDQSMKR
jgi:diacylglycerol kinase family enzyme